MPLSVSLAREYLREVNGPDGNIVRIGSPSLSDENKENRKFVHWEKAYAGQTARHTYVEAPLLYNRRITTTMHDASERIDNQTKSRILEASFERVIIYKDKLSGKVERRIVTFMPDAAYLKKQKDISHNRIGKIDKEFSGYLIYKSWDERLLFALKIKGGKVEKRVRFNQSKKNVKNQEEVKALICIDFEIEIWQRVCWESDPERIVTEEAVISERVCGEWTLVDSYTETECYFVDDPPSDPTCFETGTCDGDQCYSCGDDGGTGDGGSGGGGYGSGGGSGGTTYVQEITVLESARDCLDDIKNELVRIANVQKQIESLLSVTEPSTSENPFNPISSILNKVANSSTWNISMKEGSLEQLRDENTGELVYDQYGNPVFPNAGTIGSRITFRTEYLNSATDLAVANTMVHEVLHAYFNLGTYYTNDPAYPQFKETHELLFNKKGSAYQPSNVRHHNQIATGYVEFMADYLYKYASSRGITSPVAGMNLLEYCKDIAWSGLQESNAWRYAPNKERILEHLDNEQKNKSASTKKKGC